MGGLVTLLIYVNQFTSVFNDIAHQYTRIVEYHTDIQMTEEIVKEYKREHLPEATETLPKEWNKLQIDNINFSHSDPDDPKNTGRLTNVSITLEKGKKVALIGESGSGKSTLLSILRGLHKPEDNVRLLVDGRYNKSLASINNTVTLFPQDPEIFENSILYNITLGLPFSKEQVLKASDIAQFSDVAKNLPNQLDSNIQEKGINLSGGQKQRLALARGILSAASSEIILMDEPTSSVDPRTEAQVYSYMFEEFKNKVIVSSIHRMHLLSKFDYIYILENGRIVDEGTFQHLHNNSHAFKELWKHQVFHMDFQNENPLL